MDPLTQGALGAALQQTIAKKVSVGRAGLFGFFAGMAADLDVFFRSPEDPLLFLEYHRQFTHSLVFIPIGGMLCGMLLYALLGRRWILSLWQSFLFCTMGYATHALLDSCTSYGTQLLWPFSDVRVAWDAISIVDPLFTVPILLGVFMAGRYKKSFFARAALVWAVIYIALGVLQRERAITIGKGLAIERGNKLLRIEAKPSFANIFLWKIVYETQERFYIDAVRPSFSPKVFNGTSISKLDVSKDFPWLIPNSQQAQDIERFRWFSNRYVAKDPSHPNRVIDVRYSMVPNEIAALWSIELSKTAPIDAHVKFLTSRERTEERVEKVWSMIVGKH